MKLDVLKAVHNIRKLPEKERHDSSDLCMFLGLVSGSKSYYKKVSLEDIAHYIDNLEEILDMEYNSDIPKINLSVIPRKKVFNRRVI